MISLIIPFYNCEKQATETLNTVKKFLKIHNDTELIAVNDGSTDQTGEILKSFEGGNIRVVGYKANKGKGGAIREGVRAAHGDKIIFTDADLAYGLKPVTDFAEALDSADIAVGSRREDACLSERYGFLRTAASGAFSAICEKLLGLGLRDTQCGFKAFRSEIAKPLFERLTILGFGFDLEVLAIAELNGLKIETVPVRLLQNSSHSTVSVIRDGMRMLKDIRSIRRMLKKEGEKYRL